MLKRKHDLLCVQHSKMGLILAVILMLTNTNVSHISDDAEGVVRDPLLTKHEVTWSLLQFSHSVCWRTKPSTGGSGSHHTQICKPEPFICEGFQDFHGYIRNLCYICMWYTPGHFAGLPVNRWEWLEEQQNSLGQKVEDRRERSIHTLRAGWSLGEV